MIILRQKEFGRLKYPDDWDEDDDLYMDKIEESQEKGLLKDAAIAGVAGTLPSITSRLINGDKKLHWKSGLAMAGGSLLLGRLLNSGNTKSLKDKYRRLKTKPERERFKRNTELDPGMIKRLGNSAMLFV